MNNKCLTDLDVEMLCDHPLHLPPVVSHEADLASPQHCVRGQTCEEARAQDTTLVMINNLDIT